MEKSRFSACTTRPPSSMEPGFSFRVRNTPLYFDRKLRHLVSLRARVTFPNIPYVKTLQKVLRMDAIWESQLRKYFDVPDRAVMRAKEPRWLPRVDLLNVQALPIYITMKIEIFMWFSISKVILGWETKVFDSPKGNLRVDVLRV